MNKPRLSGAQRRKIARQNATAEAERNGGVYVPPLPTLGSLETVVDYRRELNVIYKAMRRGDMPAENATKAVFILNVGAALARAETELREQAQLREAVVALQSQSATALAWAPPEPAGEALAGELMPVVGAPDGCLP